MTKAKEKLYTYEEVVKAYLAGWVHGDLEIPGNPYKWIIDNLNTKTK